MDWVKRTWGWAWRVLLGALVLVLLLPAVLPPFLDRVYYRGPASGHFDGQRFFNPDGEQAAVGAPRRTPIGMAFRMMTMRDEHPWPAHVATRRGYPAAGGTACPA